MSLNSRCASRGTGTVALAGPALMPYYGCKATAAASNRLHLVHLILSSFLIMSLSRDVMVGMLRQGGSGEQVLQILDVIVSTLAEGSADTAVAEDAEVGEAELALA